MQMKRYSYQQNGRFAQHEELIKYIQEAWQKILEPTPAGASPTYYKNPPGDRLTGFQPFDLEAWWGRRLVQNIHNISRGHQ